MIFLRVFLIILVRKLSSFPAVGLIIAAISPKKIPDPQIEARKQRLSSVYSQVRIFTSEYRGPETGLHEIASTPFRSGCAVQERP